MTRLLPALILLFAPHLEVQADPLDPIILWPDGAPGDDGLKLPKESVEKKGPYQIDILSNVSVPTLTWYPAENPTGTAVLVCPGGGYHILASSHEGSEVCEWLNSIGISAGLLKYRVPRREGIEKHHAPLQDLQRSISLVRQSAEAWKVNPDRIGVLGFSAGGHLATMAVTSDGSRTYRKMDEADEIDCVPDFGVLVYPAYQLDESDPDSLSPEIQISESTPPCFIVMAHDDSKWAEGAARLYIEMRRNDRPCELHVFAKGGHGFGLANTDEAIRSWPNLAEQWMVVSGVLERE
ncbi:MAG: alpha/beta hydrolase [Verrucomicrobiota bacterium]